MKLFENKKNIKKMLFSFLKRKKRVVEACNSEIREAEVKLGLLHATFSVRNIIGSD